jgi:hypothetical protein
MACGAGECATYLIALARHETDGLEANRHWIFDLRGRGAVAFTAEPDRFGCAQFRQARNVLKRWTRGVSAPGAMAALTRDAGQHLAEFGTRSHSGGMTVKAAGDRIRVLHDPEGALWRCGRLGRVADGAGSMPGCCVPGDPVFEETIPHAAHGSDGLHAGSERPFE